MSAYLRPMHASLLALVCLVVLARPVLAEPQPYAAYSDFLLRTLSVKPAVTKCAIALDKKIHLSEAFDLIFHLDRNLLRAKVESVSSVFSAAQPVPIDRLVILNGSVHRSDAPGWMKVQSRCGLRLGEVVATKIDAHGVPKIAPPDSNIGD